MLIVDAMLTYAYGERGYALIPGGTKAKIRGAALSLEKSLHDPKVAEYCPELAQAESNVMGRSRGWTQDFISTRAGYVFHFIGLDEGVAGANVDNVRPTAIFLDDIDSREDSPVISQGADIGNPTHSTSQYTNLLGTESYLTVFRSIPC